MPCMGEHAGSQRSADGDRTAPPALWGGTEATGHSSSARTALFERGLGGCHCCERAGAWTGPPWHDGPVGAHLNDARSPSAVPPSHPPMTPALGFRTSLLTRHRRLGTRAASRRRLRPAGHGGGAGGWTEEGVSPTASFTTGSANGSNQKKMTVLHFQGKLIPNDRNDLRRIFLLCLRSVLTVKGKHTDTCTIRGPFDTETGDRA